MHCICNSCANIALFVMSLAILGSANGAILFFKRDLVTKALNRQTGLTYLALFIRNALQVGTKSEFEWNIYIGNHFPYFRNFNSFIILMKYFHKAVVINFYKTLWKLHKLQGIRWTFWDFSYFSKFQVVLIIFEDF